MRNLSANRFLSGMLLCWMAVHVSYASTAYPGLVDFKQPDGSVLKIRMVGDEFLKWAESEDGYSLIYDQDGFLVYAQFDMTTKDMIPSDRKATDMMLRPANVNRMLSATRKHLQYSSRQLEAAEKLRSARTEVMMRAPKTNGLMKSNAGSTTGNRKGLLILVDFPDKPFSFSKNDFQALMNQLNYTGDGNSGSVRDFYLENSFGQLDFQTDVVGVYRMSHNSAYYGANGLGGGDINPQEMASEAAAMADKDVNFADYDNDGDGVVDGFHIIYAGYGEEAGGGSDCIWAHSYCVNARYDNKTLYRYSCSPELRGNYGTNMTYIGVICHELGHVLGCMDFYDTNYNVGGQYPGTGDWDVMASGNWNNSGATPAHFNPYVKIYDFGWAEPINGNKAVCITLHSKSKNGFVRIDTNENGEYFLLEYRSRDGFDSAIPGHGLMIYRASEFLSRNGGNTINAYHKQQFYPLCANSTDEIPNSNPSSYGMVNSMSAPFPGSLNRTEISDYSQPSMKSWSGVNTNYPITSITEDVSGKSVSFDICGGDYGVAYGLKITDSGEDFLKIGWKTPQEDIVNMLVCSKDAEFDTPDDILYSSGDRIGDDDVLYVGKDLTFVHTGLKSHTSYYYKIYSWMDDSETWASGMVSCGKTQTGVIREFPYYEDFETGYLESSWKQEIVYGKTQNWSVTRLNNINSYLLYFNPSGNENHQSSMLILPVMDFTGCDNAVLSMDYRHWAVSFDVMYRNSEDSKWTLIKRIDCQFGKFPMTYEYYKNSETHIDIELPALTSEYQIAFVGDHSWRGNSKSSVETITIDNLCVNAGNDIMVFTQDCATVGASFARIPMNVSSAEPVDESGVCISTDQSNWTMVKGAADMCEINSLSGNTVYYYKGYARAGDKTVYGNILSFKTLNFSGSGTENNPIQIGSADDWRMLKNVVEQGNNCYGLYFVLSNSITLGASDALKSVFDGVLSGNGNTISLNVSSVSSSYKAIIYQTGSNAVIDGIKFNVNNVTVNANGSICVDYNYGIISNCTLETGTITTAGNYQFGALVDRNYGTVHTCTVNVSLLSGTIGYYGGICSWNYNLISNCRFYGEMYGNNNLKLGGIAAMNYVDGTEIPQIANCINYGKIHTVTTSSGAWWTTIGGICSSSYGVIDQCINKGDITSECLSNNNSNDAGGICGSNNQQSRISNCYNTGKISVSHLGSDNSAGGIVGYAYLSDLYNCINLGSMSISSGNKGSVNSLVGSNNQSVINNCYYVQGSDQNATKLSDSQLTSQDLVDCLNRYAGIDVWQRGDSHPELTFESKPLVMIPNINVETSSTTAVIGGLVFGSGISASGIQWRKAETDTWNVVEGISGRWQSVMLNGLSSATMYEFRTFAVTADVTVYSDVITFATQFDGYGTKDDPYLITDIDNLKVFRQLVHQGNRFDGQVLRLENNIDLNGNHGDLWEPITEGTNGGFSGEFDGNGKTILNMSINSSDATAGFFGTTYTCYIHDLRIVNGYIVSNVAPSLNGYEGGVGGIIGANISYDVNDAPLIGNCSFEGTIIGGNCTGGIAGSSCKASILNCYSMANIRYSGDYKAKLGGIAGEGHVENSYFAGSISVTSGGYCYIGGICGDGSSSSSVSNSYYLSGSLTANNSKGTPMSETSMTDGTLLSKLPSDVWIGDNAIHPINHGYPVFHYNKDACVVTSDAIREGTQILLSGTYIPGIERYDNVVGFEWVDKASDAHKSHVVVVSDDCFELLIDRQNADYYFCAWAWSEGKDTIYGEWKSGIMPNTEIIAPTLEILSVDKGDNNSGVVNVSFEKGNETIDEYIVGYYKESDTENIQYIRSDEFSSSITIPNCDRNTKYVIVYIVRTKSGNEYRSSEVTWTSPADDTYTYFTYEITSDTTVTITGTKSSFALSDVVIPEYIYYQGNGYHVTAIGDRAFRSKINITSVTVPGSVKSIGTFAFAECSKLNTFVMEEGVEAIGADALNNDVSIKELRIPASMDKYVDGDYMESHIGAMKSLEAIIVADGNPKLVSKDGVLYSKNMEILIKYPATGGPETYTVPEGVTKIGHQALSCTSGLKHLILPKSLSTLASTVFDYAEQTLEDVAIYATTPPSCNSLVGVNNRILYVPSESLSLYQASNGWKNFKEIRALQDSPEIPGDVNGDKMVTMADVVCIVNHLLEIVQPTFNEKLADVNNDGSVTIADVVCAVTLVLSGQYDGTSEPVPAEMTAQHTVSIDRECVAIDGKLFATVNIPELQLYSAFQMDLTLPDGLDLTDAYIDDMNSSNRQMAISRIGGNKMRIVSYSLANQYFTPLQNTQLTLEMTVSDKFHNNDFPLMLTNIRLVDKSGVESIGGNISSDVHCEGLTGIGDISDDQTVPVFDLSGRKVSVPDGGIYIIDRTKQMIRQL